MKRIIVTDIEWDAPKTIARKLPKRIVIDVTPDKEYMLEDVHDDAEGVSDYISDMTGWCHYGFCTDVEEVPDAS